jgi:hypothetical protein
MSNGVGGRNRRQLITGKTKTPHDLARDMARYLSSCIARHLSPPGSRRRVFYI